MNTELIQGIEDITTTQGASFLSFSAQLFSEFAFVPQESLQILYSTQKYLRVGQSDFPVLGPSIILFQMLLEEL